MKKHEIVTYPDARLREVSKEVTRFDLEFQQFVALLLRSMKEHDGVGLAAIQIGTPLRMIAVKSGEKGEIWVNPKIFWYSKDTNTDIEGCISIPKVYGSVRRSKKIKIRAQNLFGETKKFEAQGFYARVLQHEIDHTNGVLFIDKTERILEAPEGFVMPDGTLLRRRTESKSPLNVAM